MSYLPIELHIPSYNFCGPGTKLKKRLARGDKPINRVDAISLTHDIAYGNANDSNDILLADLERLKKLDEILDPSFKERLGRLIAKTGIKTKNVFLKK